MVENSPGIPPCSHHWPWKTAIIPASFPFRRLSPTMAPDARDRLLSLRKPVRWDHTALADAGSLEVVSGQMSEVSEAVQHWPLTPDHCLLFLGGPRPTLLLPRQLISSTRARRASEGAARDYPCLRVGRVQRTVRRSCRGPEISVSWPLGGVLQTVRQFQ